MTFTQQSKRVIGMMLMLITVGGCAKNTCASNFCAIYQPVYVSDDDTQETIDQVMRNNASFDAVCQ